MSNNNGSSADIDSHISKKYEIRRRLGKGAYGVVWKATDRKSSTIVAVKKIFDAFRNRTDAQRTFREIVFLKEFGSHPNIIQLLNVHRAANDKDLYLVFEFMETDLHHVIKKGNILKGIHRQYIMYQLFKATQFLHSGNVIHRDQKPSNILLDSQCNCKLADFGLARSLSVKEIEQATEGDGCLTDYVATRWYRAPEILLASKRYTMGVDMWSLGCILAEMLLGKPLFPGTSTINQIEKIVTTIALPDRSEVEELSSDYAQSILDKAGSMARRPLKDFLQSATPEAAHMVETLLKFNPNKRLTAHAALRHPYVQRFHNSSQEPEMRHDVIPPLSDCVQLSVEQYRAKLYDIIRAEKERKAREKADKGEKGGERRASSHELRAAKEVGGRTPEVKEKELGRVGELVRKVQSEVNVRVEGSKWRDADSASVKVFKESRMMPPPPPVGRRSLGSAIPSRTNFSPSEHKPSLQEAIKNSMKSGYCYRTASLLKNKS